MVKASLFKLEAAGPPSLRFWTMLEPLGRFPSALSWALDDDDALLADAIATRKGKTIATK